MMKKQMTLSLLILAMLASACGQESTSGKDTTAAQTSDTSAPTETEISDDLPDTLDFKGKELRILTSKHTTNSLLLVEEQTGDVVNDAVLNGQPITASMIESWRPAVEAAIDKIVTAFTE